MSVETKSIDYAAMIKDLQAKKANIEAAITNLIAASGSQVSEATVSLGGNGLDSQPVELPRGAFLGKSLPAAVKLYLSAIKRKQTIKEIVAALRDGGVESTSDRFDGVITGCLNRMKSTGEVLRFKDGWALAEFYPEQLRSRLVQDGQTKSKSTDKGRKKTKKKPQRPTDHQDSLLEGVEARIANYVQETRNGIWVSPVEVAQALNVDIRAIPLRLGRLAKKHGWEKSSDGKYRAQGSNVQAMPKAI